MKIIKDYAIRSKWTHGTPRNPDKVNTIVYHGTGGGGTYNYVLSGVRFKTMPRNKYYDGIGLFHYLIERNGQIIEVIDPDNRVFHSSRGMKDDYTIGIELVNQDSNNANGYTKKQCDSLFWLTFDVLYVQYPISIIMSHKRSIQKYSPRSGVKECPGKGFDWKLLEQEMYNRDLSYQHDTNYESYWKIGKL